MNLFRDKELPVALCAGHSSLAALSPGEGSSPCGASVLLVLLMAGCLRAQTAPSPEALVKEAESFQQAGKLDEAIKDYRMFLERYPDVFQVRE